MAARYLPNNLLPYHYHHTVRRLFDEAIIVVVDVVVHGRRRYG